jgi:hypothetical protein
MTSYEYGERPGGKRNEFTIWKKTRRDSEVRAHPGPRVWEAWPLRGNQEAPSQTGGHAKCSSRETAFVRASWVGPPNRASPMRAFVVVLGTCGAVRERVGPLRPTGLRPCVGSSSLSERCERCVSVWVPAARQGFARRAFAVVVGACGEARTLWVSREFALAGGSSRGPHQTDKPEADGHV